MSSERRRSPRLEILDRIHGHVAALDVAVTVRDMSLGGMSLETAFPFPEGAIHEFRLMLGDDSAVVMKGRIVRCLEQTNDDGSKIYLSGIQFIEDDADADGAVGGLMNKIK